MFVVSTPCENINMSAGKSPVLYGLAKSKVDRRQMQLKKVNRLCPQGLGEIPAVKDSDMRPASFFAP